MVLAWQLTAQVPAHAPKKEHTSKPGPDSGPGFCHVKVKADFCITQLKAQGPSRTCNESKEEEEKNAFMLFRFRSARAGALPHQTLASFSHGSARRRHPRNPLPLRATFTSPLSELGAAARGGADRLAGGS